MVGCISVLEGYKVEGIVFMNEWKDRILYMYILSYIYNVHSFTCMCVRNV